MPSKMVNDRQKSCEAVEASVLTHGRKVADALTARFSPLLQEGETMPDFLTLFQLTRRYLASSRRAVVWADEQHLEELADDDGPRRRRDEAADRLRDRMRGLRDSMGGLFGTERLLELTGIESAVAQDPAALAAQVKRVMERLTQPDPGLEEARFPGIRIEPQSVAETLRPDYEQLKAALSEVALEAREAETTLTAKHRALDAHDTAFSLMATSLQSFYSLAGETEIAARIRPSQRRPGQTEEIAGQGDQPSPSSEEPSAEPAAAEG